MFCELVILNILYVKILNVFCVEVVCALSKTKLKGKGEVVCKVFGIGCGRAREGVVLLPSMWLIRFVVEWKELSSRLM